MGGVGLQTALLQLGTQALPGILQVGQVAPLQLGVVGVGDVGLQVAPLQLGTQAHPGTPQAGQVAPLQLGQVVLQAGPSQVGHEGSVGSLIPHVSQLN